MKNIGDKDKLEEWFSSGDHSTNYDIWNHDDGEGAEGEEDEDEPLFDWSKDKRFLFNRLLNRVQNKVNQIYMDGSYKCSMMIRQLTNKLLEYRFCCKNAQEKIGELIDEFMVDPLCDLDSKAGSVISDRSVINAAPSTLSQEQPIDSSILSRLGEILNSNVLNRKLPLISEIPKDFLYPFPMLKLNSITQSGFKPALKCFYNLFKLYHLKRWNWSLEDCDLDTMCIVYKMVTTLEKNNAASIAKVTTLSSSTQGSVYSYHLSSANSGQIISNYNRITSRGSKGVEDERNKIKVSSLPPESEEKYEIKVNGSIKETLRGRNHDELTRKLEYETRKEISSIVASLKPDTGNEERFFEGPHEQKYVWMFKQYRSQKLQDRRIIHPKISKLMDLSFNRFGNYWVIEDLRAIKMLEDNLKLYREQQKSEDPLDIEYNYIFTSPDKEWMIDLNKCVMNSIKFDREDPKFIESKAQGIIKHKGEMVETCRIHLKRAEDFTDMGEEEDPYGNIREYLRFLDSKESQAEIAKVIMELLSDDTQVCIEENKENEVFSIKNLKKNARTLWPELKHGRYFLRFLSESDQEGILNGSLNSLKSNNQLLILSVGMMFFLEELINPTKSLKRDKYSQKIRSIFEVDKFWDYSLTKTIEAIIPSQGEATEVFNSVGKFANIFKDKEMVPLRLQNTFLMLMFKSMELYYEKESLIKPVIVIPPWGETLEDLKDIIDPSELMVKISRCHVYDLGPSKSPWGVKNKDIPFLTESLENQSFGDALLCDFITIIGNDLLSNTGVPNPPLCVYPKYYFYMKN